MSRTLLPSGHICAAGMYGDQFPGQFPRFRHNHFSRYLYLDVCVDVWKLRKLQFAHHQLHAARVRFQVMLSSDRRLALVMNPENHLPRPAGAMGSFSELQQDKDPTMAACDSHTFHKSKRTSQ